MRMVLIPPGRFRMGTPLGQRDRDTDEGPVRLVRITRPFYLGVFEVTQDQYEAVTGAAPSRFRGPRRPVDSVWWADAAEFCRRASRLTGRRFRLPTEAEWEYACRAGSTGPYFFGESEAELAACANYCDRSNSLHLSWQDRRHDDGHDATAPVGSFRPNAWGLHDMSGNVFEWTADFYRDAYDPADVTDPRGPPSGPYRVLRGGSWCSPYWMCRSAYRHRFTADGRFNHLIGFRVVMEADRTRAEPGAPCR